MFNSLKSKYTQLICAVLLLLQDTSIPLKMSINKPLKVTFRIDYSLLLSCYRSNILLTGYFFRIFMFPLPEAHEFAWFNQGRQLSYHIKYLKDQYYLVKHSIVKR